MKKRDLIIPPVCLFLVFLCTSVSVCAEEVRLVVKGIEGEALENVTAALAIPDAMVQDGSVSHPWLERFARQAEEKAKEALEPFGFYSPEIEVSLEREGEDSVLLVRVSSGEPVRVTGVTVEVTGPGSEEEALQSLKASFPIKKGDVLLHTRYEKAKADMKVKALDLGYLDAEFTAHSILVWRERHEARIELVLETGERYYFGDTHIEGGGDFPPAFLRRYLAYRTGDVYSFGRLGETRANFLNADRFREVVVSAGKESAIDRRVPVQIRLEPLPRRNVKFGVGYGTDTGVRFTTEYTDRNAFSRGHELKAHLKIAELFQGVGTGYMIPDLKDLNSFRRIDLDFEREDTKSYEATVFSLEGSSTRSLGGNMRRSLYVRFQAEDSDIASESDTYVLVMPGVRLTDRRYDDLVRPMRGFQYAVEVRGSQEMLGSDMNFLQLIAQINAVVSLPSEFRLLLRFSGATTMSDGSIDDLPVTLRFFAGGDRSVRGYSYESLGPEDENGEVVGGENLLVASAEIEREIYNNWGAAVFYDIGNAFDDFSDLSLFEAAGVGVRYYSQIGALRLDIAHQIGVDDPDIKVHFTVGFTL